MAFDSASPSVFHFQLVSQQVQREATLLAEHHVHDRGALRMLIASGYLTRRSKSLMAASDTVPFPPICALDAVRSPA